MPNPKGGSRSNVHPPDVSVRAHWSFEMTSSSATMMPQSVPATDDAVLAGAATLDAGGADVAGTENDDDDVAAVVDFFDLDPPPITPTIPPMTAIAATTPRTMNSTFLEPPPAGAAG